MGLLRQTLGLVSTMYKENGLLWTASCCTKFLIEKTTGFEPLVLDQYMRKLEQKNQLPGVSSAEINEQIWNRWDWSKQGEEWTPSEEWKQSVITHIMHKWVQSNASVLEIGPGGGRWTEYLQKLARELTIVDVAEKCIEICKERFKDCTNITYHVNDGSSLPFLKNDQFDYVWSFDVFVHIDPKSSIRYYEEFSRILKPGGIGIIHHGVDGRSHLGWRSRMTKERVVELCEKNGLEVLDQFDQWGEKGAFDVRFHHAMVTVFSKT